MRELVHIGVHANHYSKDACYFKECFPEGTNYRNAIIAFKIQSDIIIDEKEGQYALADEISDLDKDYR